MHKEGRPVLVGTTSVEKSELVGRLLDEKGISYEVRGSHPSRIQFPTTSEAQHPGALNPSLSA